MNAIELENEEERKVKAIKCEHRFIRRDVNGMEYCYTCHELIGATLDAQREARTDTLDLSSWGKLKPEGESETLGDA